MNPYVKTMNNNQKLSVVDLYHMKKNGIIPIEQEKKKTIPEAKEMIKENHDKDENILTLKYIINEKPKSKVVREYFKTKCESIVDDDFKHFENKM